MNKYLSLFTSAFITSSMGLTSLMMSSADAYEYIEPGRHGIQWTVTEDTVFVGWAYDSDKIDWLLNFSGHTYLPGKGLSNGAYAFPVNTHIGYRFNLHSNNYFAAGIAANIIAFGTDYGGGAPSNFGFPQNAKGVSLAGAGRIGPYIALQRHFPHSGLMLNIWTMPYAYQTNIANDGAGHSIQSNEHRFFESGGIGVAYLFGQSGDDQTKAGD